MPSPSPKLKEYPLTFEKGLVTEIAESTLELGQASEILNWEPTAQGGLRARNAWIGISKSGLPTNYKVRGFGSIATGASSVGPGGPTKAQVGAWPGIADADPVMTRTVTLTGCIIGNILVAVVSDPSGLTPTVTAGWTQRAIGTAEQNHVKFYTKTAAASTEPFTYTITQAKIRAVTVYELSGLDAEDPGTKWGAQSVLVAGAGTDSVTVNGVDEDGGIALIGYTYDAGTPASATSGTAGVTSTALDNANTRTTVSFEDLDQIDGSATGGTVLVNSLSYVSPSWTPPATGHILLMITGMYSAIVDAFSVVGNGLAWNSAATILATVGGQFSKVFWADCSLVTPTEGSITVTYNGGGTNTIYGFNCAFVRIIGALANPFVDWNDTDGSITAPQEFGGPSNTIAENNAVIGFAHWKLSTMELQPKQGAADFDQSQAVDVIGYTNTAFGGQNTDRMAVAWQTGKAAGLQSPDWRALGAGSVTVNRTIIEIAGTGHPAQARSASFTSPGSVTQEFGYVANKRITAKMVMWGHTPPAAGSNAVEFYVVMALATGPNTYQIYRILRDQITSGTWELIDTVTDATDTDVWASFAQGAGKLVWTTTSLTRPRAVTLNPLGVEGISDLDNKSGRAAAYHKDRMFIAAPTDNPSRLYFSDIGDPTAFVTATDFLDIGGDDGEAIQGLASIEGLLLVAKTNRAYLISGSGIESFFVNELTGGTAASGAPVVRTPYGTILAGMNDIWVVQGGSADPMSRPLGDDYEIHGNVSVAYAQDSVLIVDSANGNAWRVNLVTGSWMREEALEGENQLYHVFSLNGRLYYGAQDSDTQVGGTRRLSTGRTYDETTGAIRFDASTGRLSLLGPSYKYTPRFLWLQLRNNDPANPATLHVTIESDVSAEGGEPEREAVEVFHATQRERLDLGKHKGAEWIKISFSASSSATSGAIDVEKTVLGVMAEEYR